MSVSSPPSIPVICDRCRHTGFAGDADFTHLGDLLEFEPVPRKNKRADGWTPERQRAFIAALSATGSKRQSAMAVGMAPFGVDQLLKSEGSDSFKAAFDRAIAIAQANGSMKIAQGVADAAARNAAMTPPSRLRGLPAPDDWDEDEPDMDLDEKLELIQRLAQKFLRKVVAEREARLAGELVAADFYLRQVTALEVIFDLLTEGGGGMDAWDHLKSLQRGGHTLAQIVDTPFARYLDDKRREYWSASGDPMRPVAFREEFLLDHGDHRTAVDQNAFGACTTPARGYSAEQWAAMDYDAQRAARRAQFDEDAEAQIRWEQQAHAEFEQRQQRSSLSRSDGEGDRPRAGGDGGGAKGDQQ